MAIVSSANHDHDAQTPERSALPSGAHVAMMRKIGRCQRVDDIIKALTAYCRRLNITNISYIRHSYIHHKATTIWWAVDGCQPDLARSLYPRLLKTERLDNNSFSLFTTQALYCEPVELFRNDIDHDIQVHDLSDKLYTVSGAAFGFPSERGLSQSWFVFGGKEPKEEMWRIISEQSTMLQLLGYYADHRMAQLLVAQEHPFKGRLSPRMIELLQHLAAGQNSNQAAGLMDISRSRVDELTRQIKKRTGCQTLEQAVGLAVAMGMVSVELRPHRATIPSSDDMEIVAAA